MSTPLAWPRDPEILVIEDEEAVATAIVRLLRLRGLHHVTIETDPWRAINRYRPTEPDLMLLDLHMPGVDTFEAIRSLRLIAAPQPHLPVLAMSGDGSNANRDKALAAGATDFIAKPFTISELGDRISRLLDKRLEALTVCNLVLPARVPQRTPDDASGQVHPHPQLLRRLA